METSCAMCGGQHTTGACMEGKSPDTGKESGGKLTFKDLIGYFRQAAEYINREFVSPGRSDSSETHFRDKVTNYDQIAQMLGMKQVEEGRNQDLRLDVLRQAMVALDEDFEIARAKHGMDNSGETFGFKKDDISQLRDFVRAELGMEPVGMTEEEIKQKRRDLAKIKIK